MVMVMMFHFSSFLEPELESLGFIGRLVLSFFSAGWVGVDIFFVISGYLICEIFKRQDRFTLYEFKLFIFKRVRRLYGPYAILIVTFSFLSFFLQGENKVLNNSWILWTLFSNIYLSFYDRAGLGDQYFSLYHLWSIAIEIHFYIMFALGFMLFGRMREFSIFMIVLAIATRFLLMLHGSLDNAIYSFTFSRIDAFSLGCMVSCIRKSCLITRRIRNYNFMLGITLFLAMLTVFWYHGYQFKKSIFVQTFGYSLLDVSVSMIILSIVSGNGQSAKITSILENKILKWIGVRSYSLYLWHLPFFSWFVLYYKNITSSPLELVLFSVTSGIVFTFVAGCACYSFLEKKFTTRNLLIK